MSQVLDTPISLASYYSTSKAWMHEKEKAEAVHEAISAELSGHVRVCDTDQFLKCILPVLPGTIEGIFKRAKEKTLYSENEKRWEKYPTSKDAKEKDLYEPFVLTAEEIRNTIQTKRNELKGEWLDRHNKSPDTSDKDLADTRPDCVFVSRPAVVRELEEKVRNLPDSNSERVPSKKKKNEQLDIWWRQIHVPVEIKKDKHQVAFLDAIAQACSYLRYVLREQLDRRFAIGLVLCADELRVLFSDRSGLFFTKQPINIHSEPRKFIQVIAAFSILKPQNIGWDTQMKLYDLESGDTFPSYDAGLASKFLEQRSADIHWEIDIPSKEGGREKVITIATLSINRSEVMYGRATLVWEVVRKNVPEEIFVLKRYWRPYHEPHLGQENHSIPSSYLSEGDRYSKVPSWAHRIYSEEDIMIEAADSQANCDSTLGHIRHKLNLEPISALNTSLKRSLPRDENNLEHQLATVNLEVSDFLNKPAKDLVSRVHTQIIHEYTGWPLKHFRHLGELLRVICDVIADHKELYYEGRILHRDISMDNIIIMPTNCQKIGRLIDLDHSKLANLFRELKSVNVSPERLRTLELYCQYLSYVLKTPVSKDVIEKYLQFDARSDEGYIKEVIATRTNYFGLQMGQEINLADLGWDKDVLNPPDFTKREPRSGEQTGTLPFMSVEVLLSGMFYTAPEGTSHGPWFHDAVHDMESLFWVLTFICLTRKGPGINMIRDELTVDDSSNEQLRQLIYNYFDIKNQPIIEKNKGKLLRRPEDLYSEILANFHPYFESLKQMMLQWWRILILAYKYRKFEYWTIHDQIIGILDSAINDLPAEKCNDNDVSVQKVIERREQVRRDRLEKVKAKKETENVASNAQHPDHVGATVEASPDRAIYRPNHPQFPTQPDSPTPGAGNKRQRLEYLPIRHL